jgi:hypothetical protein
MPYLAGYSVDQQGLPAVQQVSLAAAVPITPVNTLVELLTFGTVQPGLYVLDAKIVVAQITNASVTTIVALYGAAILDAVEGSQIITSTNIFPLHRLFAVGAAGIVRIVGYSTVVTATAIQIAANNGAGTTGLVSSATLLRVA